MNLSNTPYGRRSKEKFDFDQALIESFKNNYEKTKSEILSGKLVLSMKGNKEFWQDFLPFFKSRIREIGTYSYDDISLIQYLLDFGGCEDFKYDSFINLIDSLKSGEMFNPIEIKSNSFYYAMGRYLKDYIFSDLDLETVRRIFRLKDELYIHNGGNYLNRRHIVTIPHFVKEENPFLTLFNLLIQNPEGCIVIYVNGYVPECSKNEMCNRVSDIKRIIYSHGLSGKVLVMSNLYENKVPLGTIRADMIDAISLLVSDKVSDPIISSFDSDTYKISEGFLKGVLRVFDEYPNCNYVKGNLRWTNFHNEQYAWLLEKLGYILYGDKINKTGLPPVSSGGGTSFRLKDYLGVKGYNRDKLIGEDVDLGKKFVVFGSPFDAGQRYGGKIYTDPRRGILSMTKGFTFFSQWSSVLNPCGLDHVDKSLYSTDNDGIKYPNECIQFIKYGGKLSNYEIDYLEKVINRCLENASRVSLRAFFMFWNNVCFKESRYKVKMIDGIIKIVDVLNEQKNESQIERKDEANLN